MSEIQYTGYRNELQTYREDAAVDSRCNSITFINNGSDDILLNQSVTLAPGQFIAFSGDRYDELDVTKYQISFVTTVAPSLLVVRKLVQGKLTENPF